MSIGTISDPPNPANYRDPNKYNQDMYRWACALKSQLTQQNRTINRPTSQNYTVTNFTTATTLTGTSTGTALSNFICTLVTSLQSKGIVATLPVNQ